MLEFKDRISANPNRKKLTIVEQSGNEIIADIVNADAPTQEGTALTADFLNEIFVENKGSQVYFGQDPQGVVNFTSDPQAQINTINSTIAGLQTQINSINTTIQSLQTQLTETINKFNEYLKLTGGTLSGNLTLPSMTASGTVSTPTLNVNTINLT